MSHVVTSYIEYDPESKMYVGIVPAVPGAHTQGETLDEVQKNLKEVVELCLQEMDATEKRLMPKFVALSQIEVFVD